MLYAFWKELLVTVSIAVSKKLVIVKGLDHRLGAFDGLMTAATYLKLCNFYIVQILNILPAIYL